jgi:hypothetical protein
MSDDVIPRASVRGDVPGFETSPSAEPPAEVMVVPTYPLYSSGQIAGATFLGTPLAGTWLLALNYRRLGDRRHARIALALGIVATIALIAIGFAARNATGRGLSFLGLVPVIVMSSLAKSLQGPAFERHQASGGRVGSTLRTVGVGIAGLAIALGTIFGIAAAVAVATMPSKITVLDSDVYYASGATEGEAQAVGDALVKLGYFAPGRHVSVEVLRDDGRHVVALVTRDEAFSNEKMQSSIHAVAAELARMAFANEPVDLWLVDDELEPHVKLAWESRPHEP